LNLTVDIGNTAAKAALWDGGRAMAFFDLDPAGGAAGGFPAELSEVERAIVVSTRGDVPEIDNAVRSRARHFVRMTHRTPVPLRNLYGTPATLGLDRLAAAVGAHTMFPDKTLLVVDFGTAITYDVVTAAGEFLGGNIAPGAALRFAALNEHTRTLPLGELPEAAAQFPARNTADAIAGGVALGVVAEAEWYARRAREEFGAEGVIFTGGDAPYFAERVNFPIFAVSELVFAGLNAILEHNANL